MKHVHKSPLQRGGTLFGAALLIGCISLGVFFVVSACVSSAGTIPPPDTGDLGETELWESFEETLFWFPVGESWNDNDSSLTAELSGRWSSEGSHSLECGFKMNGKNGATYYIEGFDAPDWSAYSGIVLDINNEAAGGLEVVTALCTGAAWTWQESSAIKLKKGNNRNVHFEFYKDTLKSAKTNWAFSASLEGADDVKRVAFKFFGPMGTAGKVYLDNIRLVNKEEKKTEIDTTGEKSSPRPENEGMSRDRLAILSVADNLTNGACEAYSLFELSIELDAWIDNPYDPADTTLSGTFRHEDGEEQQVDGFYYVPYERKPQGSKDRWSQSGPGFWKIRYTPRKAGEWKYMITAAQEEKDAATEWASFSVMPRKDTGFLVRKKQSTHYFKFESGDVYIPIGSNVGWYDSRGTAAYEVWFKKMAENGANYARIWFAPWGFAQEWQDTGLGDYSKRQNKASELDYVIELAEKYDIYLMLCLINHGQFSTGANPEWNRNPYNKDRGGMLDNPWNFLTNEEAKTYFKQKLRYTVARWAYSPHLFSWELWNEVNLADNMHEPQYLVPWFEEMAAYIEAADPYDHLVSSSFSSIVKSGAKEWVPLDYIQFHKYNLDNWAYYINKTFLRMYDSADKPMLMSEFGLQGDFTDPDGIHFHNGLWSALFSGEAGGAMLWWWDTYLEPMDLFYHYKGISAFFTDEAPAIENMKPVKLERYDAVEVFTLKSKDRVLYWLKDRYYSLKGFVDKGFAVGLDNITYDPLTGISFPAQDIPEGVYRIEQWDTITGEIVSTLKVTISSSSSIEVAPFSRDTAIKLIRLDT